MLYVATIYIFLLHCSAVHFAHTPVSLGLGRRPRTLLDLLLVMPLLRAHEPCHMELPYGCPSWHHLKILPLNWSFGASTVSFWAHWQAMLCKCVACLNKSHLKYSSFSLHDIQLGEERKKLQIYVPTAAGFLFLLMWLWTPRMEFVMLQ